MRAVLRLVDGAFEPVTPVHQIRSKVYMCGSHVCSSEVTDPSVLNSISNTRHFRRSIRLKLAVWIKTNLFAIWFRLIQPIDSAICERWRIALVVYFGRLLNAHLLWSFRMSTSDHACFFAFASTLPLSAGECSSCASRVAPHAGVCRQRSWSAKSARAAVAVASLFRWLSCQLSLAQSYYSSRNINLARRSEVVCRAISASSAPSAVNFQIRITTKPQRMPGTQRRRNC